MDDSDSWVVIDSTGMTYTGFVGFVAVARHSPIIFWLAPLLNLDFVSTFGEKIYRSIANQRRSVCMPEPEEKNLGKNAKRLKKIGSVILTILIIYVIIWNINSIPKTKVMPKSMEWLGSLTRLDQQFNMFAPTPLMEDGWYVFPGKLRDGTEVDVFSGKSPVSYEKPKFVAYTYKNQRWQKYLMNLWNSDFTKYRLGYGQYLCREWNANHKEDKQLMNYEITFMLEKTPPMGKTPAAVVPRVIWNHKCF